MLAVIYTDIICTIKYIQTALPLAGNVNSEQVKS